MLVAGCQEVFSLTPPPDPAADGAIACFEEDFAAGLDLMRWSRLFMPGYTTVDVHEDVLEIAMPARDCGPVPVCPHDLCPMHCNYYNGIVSVEPFDMSGRAIEVTVVPGATDGFVDTSVTLDVAGNLALFTMSVAGSNTRGFRAMINNNPALSASMPYDGATHWRFRHVTGTPAQIAFETSHDGSAWTTHHTVDTPHAPTGARLQLSAGGYQGGPAEAKVSRFDDVRVTECPR
jgi:hypothetical protein